METKVKSIETLLVRVEDYSKTSIEIMKLKFVDKTADFSSKLISRMFLIIVLSFFVLILNIGIAFWLGELLGKIYYGFLAVAGFYAFVALILAFTHSVLTSRLKNSMIAQFLK